MDAQLTESDAADETFVDHPGPIVTPPEEKSFLAAVRTGTYLGILIGIVLGGLVTLAAMTLTSGIPTAAVFAIMIGSIAGGVFLGMSIAVGLNSHSLE